MPRFPAPRFQHPVDFSLLEGEQLAIVGRNGAGKSMLVDVLTGRHPLMSGQMLYDFSPTKQRLVSDNMKYIAFRDSYGPVDGTYYYQQRWNQHDIDEEVPCVGQLLDEAFAKAEESLRREARYTQAEVEEILSERHAIRKHLYEMFPGEAARQAHHLLVQRRAAEISADEDADDEPPAAHHGQSVWSDWTRMPVRN